MGRKPPTHPDLFDAIAGMEAGMSRAEEHADEHWKLAAQSAVMAAAQTLEKLTTDDVVPLIDPGASTHEMRALGPVMMQAKRDGWIEKAYELPRPSARRHMAPLTVWRSLLFKGRACLR